MSSCKAIGFSILTVLMISFLFNGIGWAGPKEKATGPKENLEKVFWYEKTIKKEAWKAKDEFAIFLNDLKKSEETVSSLVPKIHSKAVITEKSDNLTFVKTPEIVEAKSLRSIKGISPVFYTTDQKIKAARMVLTDEIIVQFRSEYTPEKIIALEKIFGLAREKAFVFKNTYLYKIPDRLQSIEISNKIYQAGHAVYAYPNWIRTRSLRAVPNDPLFDDQWHLENTGQSGGTAGEDVNIVSAWDTYTGAGAVIAIVDDGLEIAHEDLAANVLTDLCWDFIDSDSDPTAGRHGTSAAGVAAASGFNGLGGLGAAPEAGLVGLRLIGSSAVSDANQATAITTSNQQIDIYNNSWGPADWYPADGYYCYLDGPGPLMENAFEEAVKNGRGGLGNIIVWAAGNGYWMDNSNNDGYANSRYTIAVSASTNYGDAAEYSEEGANILCNTPSSGGSLYITTTDRSGSSGYNSYGNYTDSFSGTSSAAPLLSGIIALMIEANPQLTWRDVQHILIETAEQNNDSGWETNGAGYPVHYNYGFGRVDALAATSAAADWQPVSPEASTELYTSSPNLSIPDNNTTGVSDSITVPENDNIKIEFIEVYFTAKDHTWWGDLKVELISPDDTSSVLARGKTTKISANTYDSWRFGTVRHFGEHSAGEWTLKVSDTGQEDTGTFQSWAVKFYGSEDDFTLTASADETKGTISPSGNIGVAQGASQTFSITSNTGYHIEDVLVDDVSVGAVSNYTFDSIDANHTIAVSYAINTYQLSVDSGLNGSISPETAVVEHGGNSTFTITADSGYHIDDVLVDDVSVGAVSTYTFDDVEETHTIEADFAINKYTVSATAGTNGSISPGSALVEHGNSTTFAITPDSGYQVQDVLVDGESVGAVKAYTFSNVEAAHTIEASFEPAKEDGGSSSCFISSLL